MHLDASLCNGYGFDSHTVANTAQVRQTLPQETVNELGKTTDNTTRLEWCTCDQSETLQKLPSSGPIYWGEGSFTSREMD